MTKGAKRASVSWFYQKVPNKELNFAFKEWKNARIIWRKIVKLASLEQFKWVNLAQTDTLWVHHSIPA